MASKCLWRSEKEKGPLHTHTRARAHMHTKVLGKETKLKYFPEHSFTVVRT